MTGRWMSYIAGALATVLAAPACAQDENPDEAPTGAERGGFDLSGEIGLLSDYRFRGVSRSDEDPALQAALMLGHESGLYAGIRGTTLNGVDSFRLRDPGFQGGADVELDLYAGYGAAIGAGFEVDAGLQYYVFPGGEGPQDYVEPYASLSYLIGPVYATAGAKYAPAQAAIGDESMVYLYGQVDVAIPFRPWRFSALAGHQHWGGYGSYWTWSLGVEHQLQQAGLPRIDLGLNYVDSDLPATPGQDAGLVASVRLRF